MWYDPWQILYKFADPAIALVTLLTCPNNWA